MVNTTSSELSKVQEWVPEDLRVPLSRQEESTSATGSEAEARSSEGLILAKSLLYSVSMCLPLESAIGMAEKCVVSIILRTSSSEASGEAVVSESNLPI